MANHSYNHFCPIAKVSELLEPRWTMLVLSEMWSGLTRFNEIRRGLPGMSPTLLSKRLKEMETRGLVRRCENPVTGEVSYTPTEACRELEPIVNALGKWAHRNVDTEVSLEQLDVKLLMWGIMRKIDPTGLPPSRRTIILFHFPELPEHECRHWLICIPGLPVELCAVDPGHVVDAILTADLKALTSAWMGHSDLKSEIDAGAIKMMGDPRIEAEIERWMVRSSYATGECHRADGELGLTIGADAAAP